MTSVPHAPCRARRWRIGAGAWRRSAATILVGLSLAAQACGPTPTPSEQATPVPTPPPATPTPAPPSLLFIQREGSSLIGEEVASTVAQLAEASGLVLVTSAELTPQLITGATRRVIVEGADPGLAALAEELPQVEILLIQPGQIDRLQPELQAPSNEFELRRAFSAGYASSLLAPEWRIGAILPPEPAEMHSAFIQGGVFGCGLCNPPYPPFAEYPLVEISQSEEGTLLALEALALQGVSAVYLAEGLATQASVQAAADRGMLVLGADLPPAAPPGTWAASIRPDLAAALRTLWEADANTLASAAAPLRLESVDPDVFSPGRQDDVERLFAQLESGAVRVLLDS